MSVISFPQPQSPNNSLTQEQQKLSNSVLISIIEQLYNQFSQGLDLSIRKSFNIKLNTQIRVNEDLCFTSVIVFHNEGYEYQIFILMEFKPGFTIEQSSKVSNLRTLDRSDLNTDVEKMASNYAIWLQRVELSKSESNDYERIILFDSWPNYKDVPRFPHHIHTYNRNIRSAEGYPFGGDVDKVVPKMLSAIAERKAS